MALALTTTNQEETSTVGGGRTERSMGKESIPGKTGRNTKGNIRMT